MSQPRAARPRIYVDTETTGLDHEVHDVFEVGWANDTDPVQHMLLPHTLLNADPMALKINRYHERGIRPSHHGPREGTGTLVGDRDDEFRAVLQDAVLIGENIGFDIAMLTVKFGYQPSRQPWHYRPIELSSVAMTVFDLAEPEGMAATAARLAARGFTIPVPDHTAGADVECLRACYKALRVLNQRAQTGGGFVDPISALRAQHSA